MKKSEPKISPLEELRTEKEQLRAEFSTTEDKVLTQINYVSNNFGSIVLNMVLGGFSQQFKKTSRSEKSGSSSNSDINIPNNASSTVMETVWAGLQLTYPYLIEIAKPLVIAFVTNKIGSLFKKKTKKNKKTD